MTNFIESSTDAGLVKLSGRITNYRRQREEASFVLTTSDQTTMGIVAIAAGLAGLSGQAISTASNAGSLDEEADHIKFSLDGNQVEAWVWRSPFKEGDFVEIAAEWRVDHFEAFGIARPSDRTVALYPHCSRGRLAHAKNAFIWWIRLGFLAQIILMTPIGLYAMGTAALTEPYFYVALVSVVSFYGLMFTSLAWKWRPFVGVAEKVFKALDWSSPSSIDLVRSSKAQRVASDPGEFGTFYFRY